MNLNKGNALYQGKAKTLYATDNPDYLIMQSRDDVSAFDGVKTDQLSEKGAVNNQFNAYIMAMLAEQGIANHHVEATAADESIVKKLAMLPIECVVRNFAAGSLCRRLGVEQGMAFDPPIFEFFYKDDELHDPLINECHITTFGWATVAQIEQMKQLSLAVNQVLHPFFAKGGLRLVDYKLEFGIFNGELLLGDEFTPDGCRIWEENSTESFDKDRYRHDTGDAIAGYKAAADRLGIPLTL